jgi:hypothetical protein
VIAKLETKWLFEIPKKFPLDFKVKKTGIKG